VDEADVQIERLHWTAMYFGSAALDASLGEIVSIKLPQMLTLRWPVYSDQFSKSKDRSVSVAGIRGCGLSAHFSHTTGQPANPGGSPL